MATVKTHSPSVLSNRSHPQQQHPRYCRAIAFALPVVAIALAGCGDSKNMGTVGYVQGFGGIVTGPEPRAVLAARDVLSAGGSAADAAVTLYFAMTTTLPSVAGLGAGGLCVAHDSKTKKTEVIDFLPPPDSQATVPSAVRGFYALHAKYGKLRWEFDVSEGERMARHGVLVSRALAQHLSRYGDRLDAQGKTIFFRDGRPLKEGEHLEQHDLATSLALARRNPGGFYAGAEADTIVEASRNVGTPLMASNLKGFVPQYRAAYTLPVRYDTGHFAQEPGRSGVDVPAAAFATMDSTGNSVACVLTLNDWFGSGKILPHKGFALGAPRSGTPTLGAALVTNPHSGETHMAATANDGATATSLPSVIAAVADNDRRLLDGTTAGRINGFLCREGTPRIGNCRATTDQQGNGLGTVVGQD